MSVIGLGGEGGCAQCNRGDEEPLFRWGVLRAAVYLLPKC